MTRVTDGLGHRLDQADLGFSLAEQEKAGVGDQLAALEIDGEGMPREESGLTYLW
ncbi:MAG: hypothetical protein NTV14_10190 [Coprothermobacterota bacterium]|nr:hypothetical protein [Coprothermobacterota bacterium]